MGVSGAGKSTTGMLLSERLGWPFRDADSFHPPQNIEKMSRGVPLDDEDRAPWLAAIAAWIDERLRVGEAGIVSCSALKRSYRQVLLDGRERVQLVFLRGHKPLLAARMAARLDHFMPPELLDSQFATLEEPGAEERPLIVPVSQTPEEVAEFILSRLGLASPLPEGEVETAKPSG
jgi:carbohydrate kinase (thermoresistant glucokinase family)